MITLAGSILAGWAVAIIVGSVAGGIIIYEILRQRNNIKSK